MVARKQSGQLGCTAMSKSNRWSCGTLGEGFEQVMSDALEREEAELNASIKDRFLSNCLQLRSSTQWLCVCQLFEQPLQVYFEFQIGFPRISKISWPCWSSRDLLGTQALWD